MERTKEELADALDLLAVGVSGKAHDDLCEAARKLREMSEGERIEGWVERRCNYCDCLWSMHPLKCHSSPYVDDSHNFQTRHEQNTPCVPATEGGD